MPGQQPYQLPELLHVPRLVHGFSRATYGNMSFKWAQGKDSDVVQNREQFLNDLGISIDDCCLIVVNEIPAVQIISPEARGNNMRSIIGEPKGDAAITGELNLYLVMLTADCLPVILADRQGRAVGIVHQSWRMTDAELIIKVVKAFETTFGIQAHELVVGIGPGIHQASYRVKEPSQANDTRWHSYLEAEPDGTTAVDIVQFTIDQLQAAGVVLRHITVSPIDTGATSQFFSHFRSRQNSEPEARFASVVGLR